MLSTSCEDASFLLPKVEHSIPHASPEDSHISTAHIERPFSQNKLILNSPHCSCFRDLSLEVKVRADVRVETLILPMKV